MVEPMQKAVDDFQKMGTDNYAAMVRSCGELNKGLQAIAARWAVFSKRSFDDATRAWEQMIGAKSFERAMEIQSDYAKNAYDSWLAEMSKIGEIYSSTASNAYKPAETATEKHNA